MPTKKAAAASVSVKHNALKGVPVIVTGEIDGQTRASANQILIDAGATIEKSLNKKVKLVVLGKNAGEKKIEKIEELGLETKEWDDLMEEIKVDGDEEPAGGDQDDQDNDAEEEVEEPPKPKPEAKSTAKAPTKTKAKASSAPKTKAKANAPTSGSSIAGKTVIITGTVPGHDRKSTSEILEKAGAKVAKSLNKKVELAIIATKAGPDKLKTIEDEGIDTIEWADLAEELGLEAPAEKEVVDVQPGKAPDSIDGMTLLITGTIEGHTRASAEKLLKGAGAKFSKSITQKLQLVVLGTDPGPDKLNQIAEMKIETVKFEDLVEKLGLDGNKDEPPKKKARNA